MLSVQNPNFEKVEPMMDMRISKVKEPAPSQKIMFSNEGFMGPPSNMEYIFTTPRESHEVMMVHQDNQMTHYNDHQEGALPSFGELLRDIFPH
jgi:hypothetical protein